MPAASPVSYDRLRMSLMLGALAMFGPFSIDTIFPAFGAMRREFDVDAFAIQQTLSVYLIAYASMSLWHGGVSDAVGRRPVILVSLAIFILASVGCALSGSLTELLTWRALQGMSAGAGLIVGRAIIRDCFEGADAQRLMSQVTLVFGIAPAIAPIIGGWIHTLFNWHAIFLFLVIFASALGVWVWFRLPETLPVERRTRLHAGSMLRVYGRMFVDGRFLLLAAVGTLNFSAMFIYIASAPAFLMEHLHLSETQFAWLFIPAVAGMMGGAALAGRFAGRVSRSRAVSLSYLVMFGGSAFNIAYVSLAGDSLSVPLAVLPIGVVSFGICLAHPMLTLLLLDRYPLNRGAASSMQAFLSLTWNAALAGLIAPWAGGSPMLLATLATAFPIAGLVCWIAYMSLEGGYRRAQAQARAET